MRQRACTEFPHFERLEGFPVDQTNITQIVQGQSGGTNFRSTQPQHSATARHGLQPANVASGLVADAEGRGEEVVTNDSIIDLIENNDDHNPALGTGPKQNRRHSDSDVIGVRSLQQRVASLIELVCYNSHLKKTRTSRKGGENPGSRFSCDSR